MRCGKYRYFTGVHMRYALKNITWAFVSLLCTFGLIYIVNTIMEVIE